MESTEAEAHSSEIEHHEKVDDINKEESAEDALPVASTQPEEEIQASTEVDDSKTGEDMHPHRTIPLVNSQANWHEVQSCLVKATNLTNLEDLHKIIRDIVEICKNKPEEDMEIIETLNFVTNVKVANAKILPMIHYIASLALRVDNLFSEGRIRFLRKNKEDYITFTSEECACIIALAFFCCMIPAPKEIACAYPINFIQWYSAKVPIYEEKIHFFLCYFETFKNEDEAVKKGESEYRILSFERHSELSDSYTSLDDNFWCSMEKPLLNATLIEEGGVVDQEKEDQRVILTNFANRFLGGGVMRKGAVQEEILFLRFPELLLSSVVCAKMEKNESVTITGPKLYSNNEGYSNKTKFAGKAEDPLNIDEFGRIDRTFVCIDALRLKGMRLQVGQFYQQDNLRELNKAYIGFRADSKEEETKGDRKTIVTGKWGCGAYNGNPELKFILQWIACSAHDRDIIFTTFGEKDCANIPKIIEKFQGKPISEIFLQIMNLRGYIKKKDGNGDKTKGFKNKKGLKGIVWKFIEGKDKQLKIQ
ncbi:unnamed protein product [Moneuplotes crassus]|uniref:poly(ADP-ribose) glycohydrolase n=1 Tax=Euplotes crassus TaxID=5936 RepID=A0AAD1X7P1_EUPCR|nr:unnamed protein product [Moneuplotes crassus]